MNAVGQTGSMGYVRMELQPQFCTTLRFLDGELPMRTVWYSGVIESFAALHQSIVEPGGWQGRHFAIAPFGSALSTWLWAWWKWSEVPGMVSWGVLTYGMAAIAIEGVFQVFYYFYKRNKDRQEARIEGRDEGFTQGRDEGLAEGRDEGRSDRDAEWREWYERQVARGVEIEEPPK